MDEIIRRKKEKAKKFEEQMAPIRERMESANKLFEQLKNMKI
jgi:hypothetical protein